jgi:rod shape-determining protein MreC
VIQLSSPLSILEWGVIHPFEPLDAVDEPVIPVLEDNAPRNGETP